ncbi:lysophospholipid acyltransferase family protein [Aliiglaciecola sp. 3_MG-2023]|uniref:lysophospholipid acyltransferase family protein n=1 Tax=Aliiglaciecola sp. 3_MG-2023 TaxID=3062644 RepID=UPI0026E145E8|nr:lysophospholipid acyltransferase family protein [Aliiglaciecola sp. 3_MG-2023]MDO6695059.1 lysophospholipid acyltransferase family protein [Aliiglaciecola sp. 3_MG-2023]
MQAKLNFAWRWFATAFSFFVFGVGGIIIPVIVVPVLFLLPGTRLKREARGQKFIHIAFSSFIKLMRFLGVLTYEIHGAKELRQAKLVLANHPTLLDVVFLIALIPNANCVVKGALLRNPFMRGAIRAAGYTINNGEANDVLIDAKEVFNKQQIMIVFPEGTRSVPGKSHQLKRGAANIAIRTNVDITPVIISCEPISLTKQDKWYHIPSSPMHFNISANPIIKVSDFQLSNSTKNARLLTDYLTKYFNAEVGVNDSVAN